MKKGRHRRYEEARALKRGSDLDIDSIFSDLSADQGSAERGAAHDVDVDDLYDDEYADEDSEDHAERH